MKIRFQSLVTTLALVALNQGARAQGTAFTYQGQLRDGPNVANGNYDLRFALYDAVTAGGLQGNPLTNAATAVSNGLFTVNLNFGAGVFNGANRWLEVSARTNGNGAFTLLTPRQPVTPTPYALFAGSANAAGLNGLINGSQIAPGSISASQISNSVSLWDRSGNNLYYLNGNVGVGTAAPQAPLHVVGGIKLDGSQTFEFGAGVAGKESNAGKIGYETFTPETLDIVGAGTNGGGRSIKFWAETLASFTGNLHVGGPGANGEPKLVAFGDGDYVSIGENGADDRMELTASRFVFRNNNGNGYVGIGLTNPITKLHVAAGASPEISLESLTTNGRRWTLQSSDGNPAAGNGTFQIIDRTTNASRLLITPDGIVGIGTTVPNGASKLDVAGMVRATSFVGDGSGLTGLPAINASQLTNGTLPDARLSANVALRAGGNLFTGTQVINSGNLGLGVTNPAARLQVAGSGFFGTDGGGLAGSVGAGVRVFFDLSGAGGGVGSIFAYNYASNTAQNLTLQAPGGNVGIGTFNPQALLHLRAGNDPTLKVQSDGTDELSGRVSLRQSNESGYDMYYDGNNAVDALVFESFTSGTATAKALVMKINGDVGIGATNPATKLHVMDTGDTELSLQSAAGGSHRWTLQASSGNAGGLLSSSFQIIDRSAAASRLLIATNGNVGIGTSTPGTKLDVNGEITVTAVNITSDRNAKEEFKPVNAREVLAKVTRLPISEWQYKTQGDARHIGPMAQDFHAAFSVGRDEKHITTVDADGVALAAIQGLNEKLEEKNQEVEALKQSVAELRALVAKIAAQQGGGAR